MYFNKHNLFEQIKNACGVDLSNKYSQNDSLYMYDYYYMNEFLSPNEILWWETCEKITGIKPGDTIYFTQE